MDIKKVLIIDDEMLMRTTIKILLSNYNIETILAPNGNEGILLAEKEKPDIILLDLMLPDIDGWKVLEKVRENPQTENIPIVIFSAMDLNIEKEETKKKGIVSIIRKPFQLKQLLNALKIGEGEGKNG